MANLYIILEKTKLIFDDKKLISDLEIGRKGAGTGYE